MLFVKNMVSFGGEVLINLIILGGEVLINFIIFGASELFWKFWSGMSFVKNRVQRV